MDFKDLFAVQLAKLRLTEIGFNFIPALRNLIEATTKKVTAKALIVKENEKYGEKN